VQVSMVISKILVKANYSLAQYLGAAIVAAGIAIVLLPTFQVR
jgi:hypothetical protein